MPIRVLAVDDHLAVRHGLADLLEDEEGIELVGVVSSPRETLIEALRLSPDVAVVDYQLGPDQRDGLSLSLMLRGLPRPPRVLIYSAYADSTLAVRAVVAGADGLVSKGSLGTEVVWAIHAVASGRRVLPPIAHPIADGLRRRLQPVDQALLGMAMEGATDEEIGRVLKLPLDRVIARRREVLATLARLPEPVAGSR